MMSCTRHKVTEQFIFLNSYNKYVDTHRILYRMHFDVLGLTPTRNTLLKIHNKIISSETWQEPKMSYREHPFLSTFIILFCVEKYDVLRNKDKAAIYHVT